MAWLSLYALIYKLCPGNLWWRDSHRGPCQASLRNSRWRQIFGVFKHRILADSSLCCLFKINSARLLHPFGAKWSVVGAHLVFIVGTEGWHHFTLLIHTQSYVLRDMNFILKLRILFRRRYVIVLAVSILLSQSSISIVRWSWLGKMFRAGVVV